MVRAAVSCCFGGVQGVRNSVRVLSAFSMAFGLYSTYSCKGSLVAIPFLILFPTNVLPPTSPMSSCKAASILFTTAQAAGLYAAETGEPQVAWLYFLSWAATVCVGLLASTYSALASGGYCVDIIAQLDKEVSLSLSEARPPLLLSLSRLLPTVSLSLLSGAQRAVLLIHAFNPTRNDAPCAGCQAT